MTCHFDTFGHCDTDCFAVAIGGSEEGNCSSYYAEPGHKEMKTESDLIPNHQHLCWLLSSIVLHFALNTVCCGALLCCESSPGLMFFFMTLTLMRFWLSWTLSQPTLGNSHNFESSVTFLECGSQSIWRKPRQAWGENTNSRQEGIPIARQSREPYANICLLQTKCLTVTEQ